MSFRKKIIFSQLLLFIAFIGILFPFVERTVQRIVRESFEESTEDLIDLIDDAQSEEEMIQRLKDQEFFVFYRITLLSSSGEILYDSHLHDWVEDYNQFNSTEHPEIQQALEEGSGYTVTEANGGGKFAFVAEKFSFLNREYILRTAFPFAQIQDLTENFKIGFLIFSFISLLFFMALTWLIFNRLSRPIRQIIDAIHPYQMGQSEEIGEIVLGKNNNERDEFFQLARTINSLSERIRTQIQSVIAERNEKEAILESLGEGVIAVDQDMQITYVNFMGSKMLGIPRRNLRGHPFPDTSEKTPSILLKRCKELLKLCQEQNGVLTDSISFGTEKKVYLDLIAAPKAKGSGAIIVLQDKSSHYKVIEMGKDFVANASHELRTPITIIKGFAETLQDLPEMSREMLSDITEKIVRNCQRMENLVKNLLRLADLENIPESRFKECDLVSLIENCKHTLLSVHPECKVEIQKTDDEMKIAADSDILELALMNLLDNAAKYSKPPAWITISLRSIGQEEVEIRITDRGMGIPPEDLEHIFERFYTVDKARSRRLGGAGLGLSIVRTIIDKHDGMISATSTVGKGTTFTIVLPKHRHGYS